MNASPTKGSLTTWKFTNPETFELTLRRLMEPSAESKMISALDKVMADIAEASRGSAAEQREKAREALVLERKRNRLERRLTKLQELKRMAVGPLLISLFIAFITWLVILGVTGLGAVTATQSIAEALAKDKETIAENSSTGLTIKELDADIHVGQLMGMPGGGRDENGDFIKEGNGYKKPDYLLEVTKWEPEFDSCSDTLSKTDFTGELNGCNAAAMIEVAHSEFPEITTSCLFLQLGDENSPSPETSKDNQLAFAKQARFIEPASDTLKPNYWTLGPDNGWDEVTMLWCQTFGTEDESLGKEMAFTLGQAGIRIDAKLYLAGGIFTWLESDGSYAPERVWEGHAPEKR